MWCSCDQALQEWQSHLRVVRSQYYCLNYFVVKHLQRLRDDFLAVDEFLHDKGILPVLPDQSEKQSYEEQVKHHFLNGASLSKIII